MDDRLERPDARIAYRVDGADGTGTPVVVAHSFLASRELEDALGVFDWSGLEADGHPLVRFDARGHGASSGGADPEQYRWSALADDLLAVLDAAVPPPRPVDAVAESTGAGALLWAALRAPERFRRLVLVIPPTSGEERRRQVQLYLAAADLVQLRGAEAWERLIDTFPPVPLLSRGGWARARALPVPIDVLPAVLRGAAASDLPDDELLATIRQPTLVLAWTSDSDHPTSTAEHLAATLPDSRLEVATDPEHVRGWGRAVAAFLGSTAGPTDG